MEKNQSQPNENNQVAKFDPAVVYAGVSSLRLTETEMTKLSASFDDMDFEIRPDGFIYLPAALTLQRLNNVIGLGQWGLLLINASEEERNADVTKVYYDGALMVRNCFVSRSCGESQYSKKNANQSRASALEAAKTDCRQRCGKDLGIGTDAWSPSFTRRWQRDHAIRVYVNDNGQNKVLWRRKDLDPFWNETGPVPTTPTIPGNVQQNTSELPWLNHGPDYDAQVHDLIAGIETLAGLRATKFKVSKQTEAAIIDVLTRHWINKTDECADLASLTKLYNDNKTWIDAHLFIQKVFSERRVKVVKKEAKVA
jgi:hypothetical protein